MVPPASAELVFAGGGVALHKTEPLGAPAGGGMLYSFAGRGCIDKWRDECFIYLWPILPPY